MNNKQGDLKKLTKLFENSQLTETDFQSVSDFSHDLAFEITENNNLRIYFVRPEDYRNFSKFYTDENNIDSDINSDAAMVDMFDGLTSNGLSWVSPEDIGALTDGPILTDSNSLFFYNDYAIRSPLSELAHRGDVVFHYVGEYSDPEEEFNESTYKSDDVSDDVAKFMLEALIEVEQMIHAGELNEGTMAVVREAIAAGIKRFL